MSVIDELEEFLLNAPFKRFYFNFWHDWDSLIFWKPMNWRDFHVIRLTLETNPHQWVDIELSLFGFNFCFTIFKRSK